VSSAAASSSVMPTYARAKLSFERGDGVWLTTVGGERYLDFGAGIAVSSLGHSHQKLVKALTDQAKKLWHTSNLYTIPEGEKLAEQLCELTFADVVFFSNSGAEANEGAIKTARKYHSVNGHPERNRIITFEGAFHGRTLATIAAGGQKKYLEGFGPAMPGFDQVPFGDHEALEAAITSETAAILIEPVQGEGGLRSVPTQCLRGLRALCDKHGLLLIFDEVQTGVGRTGKLFAYEWSGVAPDIMAIAKGIGGGFPMGAVLATQEAAKGMTAGTHGSTYGGNPLAMVVGAAVLKEVSKPRFLKNVQKMALLFRQRLAELKDRYPDVIDDIRGSGLLMGVRTVMPNTELQQELRDGEKMLTVTAGDNVVRLIPPLIINEKDVAEAINRLDRACATIGKRLRANAKSAAE
jgi:acetylornithine/N-succinyldiaminopimelate aminotransferase